jgi:hypothetical protein
MNELLQCRSVTDALLVQSAFVRENMERFVENNQRLAQLTAQVTQDAVRSITSLTDRNHRAS